jgi:NADPH:quinone reductase-like Zn-dependent oxidoreductase
MKASVHERYGPPEVQEIRDVERPTPKEDELLVRVRATTVNQTDCHRRAAKQVFWRFIEGFLRPKQQILGTEFAGEVEAVGSAVTEFRPDDRVFGWGWNAGAHAEYLCVRGSGLVAHMPDGMRFEEAAAICDGAYQGRSALRAGNVAEGTRLVVYGASGSLGTAAVQLARHLGAHVTAVCNTKNIELVRSLGADEVVDYLREDFTKNGQEYDVIVDAVGKYAYTKCRRALRPGGIFVATDRLRNLVLRYWTRWFDSRKVVFRVEWPTREDILFYKSVIEAGEYRAVIDRVYPLEDVVEATHYVESWQKTGNVVLTLNGGPPE